ncbi:flavin reductase family protein [Angustibacter aerolatus]
MTGDATGVEAARYRRALGRFPTGVTVVTARVGDIDHAMTASAFTSVSLDPPLVLVCVEQEARFHDAVEQAQAWGVSLLEQGGRPVSQWLATRGRPLHGQLDRVPHRRGAVTGVALLTDSVATLEVRTTALHAAGDHSIVVGEVVSVGLPDEPGPPLVYHRGGYTHLA